VPCAGARSCSALRRCGAPGPGGDGQRIRSRSRCSPRAVRRNRSARAFACGARVGVSNHPDPLAAEEFVEGGAELAVTVVDEEPHLFRDTAEAEVARPLGDPAVSRIGGAASEVNAAAAELDGEEHVVTAERERLDGEEATGERARRLL
jgi:hypothetical protein